MAIKNGSFEQGWVTLADGMRDGNQEPAGWQLSYVAVGETLYDDETTTAEMVAECVHKFAVQLPPDEQVGAERELIWPDGGQTVYKAFGNQPFGVELSQTVRLPAGSRWRLSVPVQVVHPPDVDPWSAESGVFVQGNQSEHSRDWLGRWANLGTMGHRAWYEHVVKFIVPMSGVVRVRIRLKVKWAMAIDFFVDGVQMEAMGEVSSPPIPAPPVARGGVVRVTLPPSWTVEQVIGDRLHIDIEAAQG